MTEATPVRPELVSKRAWNVLAATALTNFVVGLDLSITNVAIPDLETTFRSASTADLSWVLTFYMVTYAGLLIVAGRWADRFGRLRVLNIGITLFAAGATIAAVSPTLAMLIAARGLQGMAVAMMTPSSLGLAVAAFPVERRGTAVAIWSSTLALSSAVGPIVGGFLIEQASWRWAYALVVPIAAIALAWGRRVLNESERDPNARRPDAVGSTLLGGATGGLALAIVQGREWGWTSPIVLALFAGAVVAVGLVAHRTSVHPDPIVPRTLLAVRSFRVASGSLFLFGLGFFAMILTMVLYLTEIADYSTLRAGLAISMLPVAATIASNIAGRLADRHGYRAVAIPGMASFTAGASWLWFRAAENPTYVVDVLPGLLLAGIGIGAGPAILAGAGVSEVDPVHFSLAGAVTQTARQLAGAIGVAVVVAMIGDADAGGATVASFQRAFIFLGCAAASASLLATLLPKGSTRSRQNS